MAYFKYYPLVFFLYLAIFLFSYSLVLADTPVSGAISTDTTWSPAGGVYIIDSSFSVASGTTLTIKAGTIVKAKISNIYTNGPSIYGNLIANGTSELPIHFTSFRDDIGGDTNGDGVSAGIPGEWQGLYFKPGSEGNLNHIDVSNAGAGGYGWGRFVGISNDGGVLNIQNSNIHDNYRITSNGAGGLMTLGFGIYNKSGTLSVSDSTVSSHLYGIYVGSGTITVSNTIFENNIDSTGHGTGYGIYAHGQGSLTLLDNTFSGNTRTLRLDASLDFVHEGNTSTDLSERGFSITGIVKDGAVWHSRDLPMLLTGGSVTIPSGMTLTLEPGTIIKLGGPNRAGAITVRGSLISRGTKENKIYLTSAKDDSVGGDTNVDGVVSSPAPRDWNAIFLENGSSAEFEYTTIKYSGYNYNGEYLPGVAPAIYNRGSNLSIKDSFLGYNWGANIFQDAGVTNIYKSELTGSSYGLQFRGGEAVINQSSLHDHGSYAVYNQSGLSVDARYNWWGSNDGPRDTSTSTPTGTGDRVSANVEYIPFLTEPPSDEPERNPVIIVPGIAGTELYNGDDLIWPDLNQMFNDINDDFLKDLILDENGQSMISRVGIGKVIEEIRFRIPVLDTEIQVLVPFLRLIADLEESGYIKDVSFFAFPYDWRLNLETTKDLLNQKIEELKLKTGKVDIIAHSMGGLLAKAYLDTYGNGAIDKLIFVGTPHLGAPKAGKVLLQGDRFGIPWLENDRIKEIAENSPAIHQLLPSKIYFDQFQGYIKVYGDNQLRDYESTKTFFIENHDKNPLMFQIAEAFSDKNYTDTSLEGLNVYNIVGCKQSTQSAYFIGGLGAITKIGYSSGDGTVPLVSADYISTPSSNKFYVKNGNHAELSSTDGVRELITEVLNGGTGILSNNISSSSSFCNFKGKTLNWRSPVEVHIYDQFNNHTGLIENNAIEYGIPDIDYEIIGHEKFIFLPTDEGQLYRIEARGTDSGTFDLLISENENGLVLETNVFNDIPVDTSTQIQFEVSDTSEDNAIEIKVGEEEPVLVETNSILNSEESEDVVPPETQIILTGKEYKDGEYKKEVEVNFSVIDDNSGVLETGYSLDGQNFFQYTNTFTLGAEGVYNVYYYSVDRAGNNEEIKSVEIVIGKLSKYLRKLDN